MQECCGLDSWTRGLPVRSLHVLHCVSLQVPLSHRHPRLIDNSKFCLEVWVWTVVCLCTWSCDKLASCQWRCQWNIDRNRQLDGVQSSLADIVSSTALLFLFQLLCVFPQSCLNWVCLCSSAFLRLNWPCRSSSRKPCRQGSWPALSTQLPCAPWHLGPWHCGCRQVPLPSFRVRWSTPRSSGPPRGHWGPPTRPLFSLLTDHEPETDLVSMRGAHLTERAGTLSWWGGD